MPGGHSRSPRLEELGLLAKGQHQFAINARKPP